MFGIVRATGHATDVVTEGLQCVHLGWGGAQGLSDSAPGHTGQPPPLPAPWTLRDLGSTSDACVTWTTA